MQQSFEWSTLHLHEVLFRPDQDRNSQLIGALDARNGRADTLVSGADASAIAVAMVRAAQAGEGGLVTIYYGSGRKLKDAEAVALALHGAHPSMAVETYYGGQPTSDFVISVER